MSTTAQRLAWLRDAISDPNGKDRPGLDLLAALEARIGDDEQPEPHWHEELPNGWRLERRVEGGTLVARRPQNDLEIRLDPREEGWIVVYCEQPAPAIALPVEVARRMVEEADRPKEER